MEIVYAEEELSKYMETAVDVNPEQPILIDKYMIGKELEVDPIVSFSLADKPQLI